MVDGLDAGGKAPRVQEVMHRPAAAGQGAVVVHHQESAVGEPIVEVFQRVRGEPYMSPSSRISANGAPFSAGRVSLKNPFRNTTCSSAKPKRSKFRRTSASWIASSLKVKSLSLRSTG